MLLGMVEDQRRMFSCTVSLVVLILTDNFLLFNSIWSYDIKVFLQKVMLAFRW